MVRPSHLPDFVHPPLDEVVLGVQFSPSPYYTSVNLKDVWELYREEFSGVEEKPALEPAFETFGGPSLQPNVQFRFGPPPIRSRMWFISSEQNHLIQFQQDRFLLNWRRGPTGTEYPHFEDIAQMFSDNLTKLAHWFESIQSHPLEINQAEVSYINIVPVDAFASVGDWFIFWGGGKLNIEGLNTTFGEVLCDTNGKPYARLLHELLSVSMADGKSIAFRLSLTVRGAPLGSDISTAMSFLEMGRERIVTRFTELTTEQAHQRWGRLV
jgi:uncharacterized protein (TIGR04255 family)